MKLSRLLFALALGLVSMGLRPSHKEKIFHGDSRPTRSAGRRSCWSPHRRVFQAAKMSSSRRGPQMKICVSPIHLSGLPRRPEQMDSYVRWRFGGDPGYLSIAALMIDLPKST
jgi:hypothetical protein